MIDMPEILLRMKVGNELSLKDLQDIFNKVCNQIKQEKAFAAPPLATL
jgi:hypothetical protein